MSRRFRAWAFAALTVGATTPQPAGHEADLQVQRIDAVRAHGLVTVTLIVYNDHDAGARNAALHLFLPVGSAVSRVPPGCLPSPSPDREPARVDCALGDIRVRDSRQLSVVAAVPATPGPKRFAAFVLSDTPDPNIGNNFGETSVP